MFPKRTAYDFSYNKPAVAGGIMTLADINRISPFFTDTNPVSYAVFLEANKGKLTQAEEEQAKSIIAHLTHIEQEAIQQISGFLKERKEYEELQNYVKVVPLVEEQVSNNVELVINEFSNEVANNSV